MQFFGEAIEGVESMGTSTKKRGPQNLLDLLPDIFTREEAGQMRLRLGVVSGSLSSMLSTWKNRKYIECYGEEMTRENSARNYTSRPSDTRRGSDGKRSVTVSQNHRCLKRESSFVTSPYKKMLNCL